MPRCFNFLAVKVCSVLLFVPVFKYLPRESTCPGSFTLCDLHINIKVQMGRDDNEWITLF